MEQKKERWRNVYLDSDENEHFADGVFETLEEAKENLPRRYIYTLELNSNRIVDLDIN